jgi:mRNA interferase MazF
VVCVTLTTNLRLARAPGNIPLEAGETGLPQDSVVNVSQIVTIDRGLLTEFVGTISRGQFELILRGIDLMLGR